MCFLVKSSKNPPFLFAPALQSPCSRGKNHLNSAHPSCPSSPPGAAQFPPAALAPLQRVAASLGPRKRRFRADGEAAGVGSTAAKVTVAARA